MRGFDSQTARWNNINSAHEHELSQLHLPMACRSLNSRGVGVQDYDWLVGLAKFGCKSAPFVRPKKRQRCKKSLRQQAKTRSLLETWKQQTKQDSLNMLSKRLEFDMGSTWTSHQPHEALMILGFRNPHRCPSSRAQTARWSAGTLPQVCLWLTFSGLNTCELMSRRTTSEDGKNFSLALGLLQKAYSLLQKVFEPPLGLTGFLSYICWILDIRIRWAIFKNPNINSITRKNPKKTARAPRLHGSAPSKVVLNSATKNAADPSKLYFRILTTEDDASELLEKVKYRCGVAEIWSGFFFLWVAPDKNGRVWIIPVCSSHSATRQYCWKIIALCLVCNEWTILYN